MNPGSTTIRAGLASALMASVMGPLAAQTPQMDNSFSQTNLVANDPAYNPQIVDPNMLDAWGIAIRPPGAGGHFWVNNAFYGTSDEFIGDVNGVPLHQDGLTSVTVHTPRFTDHGYAFVTGVSYNAAKDVANQPVEFPVPDYNVTDPGQVIRPGDQTQAGQPAQDASTHTPIANTSGASAFAFVTEDGCVNCWRSNTTTAMTDVPVVVDYSKTGTYPYAANSVFSGCAFSTNAATSPAYTSAGGNHLFVADFRNNVIEVFDNQWRDVTGHFAFTPPATVTAPTFDDGLKLHVFNVLDLNGHLFVTYAVWNEAGDEGMEETDGPGYGHVAEFNEDGTFVKDFNDQGNLNAPWGMAIAPAGFGKFGGDLLVANFGDGTVAAFDPNTGNFVDFLRDSSGDPVSIDGIWGLTFGNGVSLGDLNSLYFTAGPNSEFDGLFGKLTYDIPPTAADTPAMPLPALVLTAVALLLAGAGLRPGRLAVARASRQ